MKNRSLATAVFAVVILMLAGCSSNVRPKDVKAAGHPEVVYIRPPANLYVPKPVPQAYAPAGGGFIGGAILGAFNQIERENHRSDYELLTGHETEVAALGFDDQAYQEAAKVIAATPWLAGAKVSTVQRDGFDAAEYVRQSKADSVVFIAPEFTLGRGNSQHFGVVLHVSLMRRDPRNALWLQDLRDKDISSDHTLTLVTPAMSWDQQKAAAYQVASMSIEQAREAWLADGGVKLKGYFVQDLSQMDAGLRQFFGD